MRRVLFIPVAAALLFASVACGGDSGDVPSDAIAVVGGQTVAKDDFDRLLDQARANSRGSRRPFPKPGTPQYVQIHDQLVQFLVRRAQLAEEAEERGLEVSDEQVERRREELVQQFFRGDDELYDKHLEKTGVTEEQLRADIKASMIQEALFKDVAKDVKVSEAELRKHYRKNERRYSGPYEQVKKRVRQDLLQRKRSVASAKYVQRIARSQEVRYQQGFAPRTSRQSRGS
jgi:FKBP-type peptidyl-prolyl cis-trans isomerase (trigger factor)